MGRLLWVQPVRVRVEQPSPESSQNESPLAAGYLVRASGAAAAPIKYTGYPPLHITSYHFIKSADLSRLDLHGVKQPGIAIK